MDGGLGEGVVRGFAGLFSAMAGGGVEKLGVFFSSPAPLILLAAGFFVWLSNRARRR